MVQTEEINKIMEEVPKKFGSGPRGLGDPDDRSLRKVEVEVLIPQIMRDRAKKEKCVPEVAAFEECCKNSSILMVVKCRDENSALKNCIGGWYKNKEFINECTEHYINERSVFRRTGLVKKYRTFLREREAQKKLEDDAQQNVH